MSESGLVSELARRALCFAGTAEAVAKERRVPGRMERKEKPWQNILMLKKSSTRDRKVTTTFRLNSTIQIRSSSANQ